MATLNELIQLDVEALLDWLSRDDASCDNWMGLFEWVNTEAMLCLPHLGVPNRHQATLWTLAALGVIARVPEFRRHFLALCALNIKAWGPVAHHPVLDPHALESWFFEVSEQDWEEALVLRAKGVSHDKWSDMFERADVVRELLGHGFFLRESEIQRWVKTYPPLDL